MELEFFITMLNRTEIPFEMEKFDGGRIVLKITVGSSDEAYDDGPLVGYGMFFTEFTFNIDGMLTKIGIWE